MMQIEVQDIYKEYGKNDNVQRVINKVSFSVKKGEMVAVVGPSGSGKTTLMNIMGMLDVCTGGNYYFNGNSVNEMSESDRAVCRNDKIGFVFQNFNLINELTALENVKLNIQFHNLHPGKKVSRKDAVLQSKLMLEKVGLADHINKYPSQLSGGQQQRVAIARSIVNVPDLILADEPTGALDSVTTAEIMNVLKELNNQGHTLIIVTHNNEVASMCSRTIELRDGNIIN